MFLTSLGFVSETWQGSAGRFSSSMWCGRWGWGVSQWCPLESPRQLPSHVCCLGSMSGLRWDQSTHLWPQHGGQFSYMEAQGAPTERVPRNQGASCRLRGLRSHLVSLPPHSLGDTPATRPARFYTIKSMWYGRYYFVHLCKNTICHRQEGEGQQ